MSISERIFDLFKITRNESKGVLREDRNCPKQHQRLEAEENESRQRKDPHHM